MQPQESQTTQVEGEPLDLEILLSFATISQTDIASAIQWFDENASDEWIGALDNEPIKR